jgi:hypothetical protein
MKSGRQTMQLIEEALAQANPVPAEELSRSNTSVEAETLRDRILSTPPNGSDRHAAGSWTPGRLLPIRKAWAGIVVAAAAAAITAMTVSAQISAHAVARPHAVPRPHAAARSHPAPVHAQLVEFTHRDGSLVVKITDPDSPVSQLNAIFRAHGLHIKINVIPVSPGLVGTIIYSDIPATRELQGGDCRMGGGGRCWIGFILPPGFTGSGNLTIGRQARPGEKYMSTEGGDQPRVWDQQRP